MMDYIQAKKEILAFSNQNYSVQFQGTCQENLNRVEEITAQVQKRLGEYLESQNNQKVSLKGRIETYQNLSESLKLVADRVRKSKGIFSRFIGYFVCTSGQERRLNHEIIKINKLLGKAKSKEAKMWTGGSYLYQFSNWCGFKISKFVNFLEWGIADTTSEKIRTAAFRVMGTDRYESTDLEGGRLSLSFRSLILEMNKFKSSGLYQKEDEGKIKRAIDLMEFAREINNESLMVQDTQEMRLIFGRFNKKAIKTEVACKVAEEIAALPTGASLILRGGYTQHSSGHAVIFEVKKVAEDNFTFTVINTGSGAEAFASFFQLVGSAFTGFFSDCKFSNLKKDQVVDLDFLKQILNSDLVPEGQDPIEHMFQPLIDHLVNGDRSQIESGRSHAIQINGTCTYESIMCWLESFFQDNLLFERFKLFITRESMSYLESLEAQELSYEDKTKIAALKATYAFEQLQGMSVISQLIKSGKSTLEVQKKSVAQRLSGKVQQYATEKFSLEEQKDGVAQRLTEEKNTQFLRELGNEVNALRKKYNELAGNKGNDLNPASPNLFTQFVNPDLKMAWDQYSTQRAHLRVAIKESKETNFFERMKAKDREASDMIKEVDRRLQQARCSQRLISAA